MGVVPEGRRAKVSKPDSEPYLFNRNSTYDITVVSTTAHSLLRRANIFFGNTISLNAQSQNSTPSCCLHHNQMMRINKSIDNNTDFLQALTDFLPTLQRIVIAKEDQLSHSSENTNLINIMKEVHEAILQIYRIVLQRHTVLSPQVQRQQPVYFQDACGFHTPFHLEFITSWDEFITVLKLKFRNRGLRLIEQGRYTLQDANSKKILNRSRPWTLCFFPGQHVNMDALFDEKGDGRNCCPVCQHVEAGTFDDVIDWWVIAAVSKIRFLLLTFIKLSVRDTLPKNRADRVCRKVVWKN